MVDAVVADLYGTSDDEIINEAPLERYIVGILHPQRMNGGQQTAELADEEPDGESTAPDTGYDPGVSVAHLRYPSTIGLTFGVTETTPRVLVGVSADRYAPLPDDEQTDEDKEYWRRDPFVTEPAVSVDLNAGSQTLHLAADLVLRAVVREPRDGVVNMTLVLVNTARRPEKGQVDHLCWFRPQLTVRTEAGEFADRRPRKVLEHLDDDERGGELLYRHQRHLAVGHGTAVTWDEGEHVTQISTTFFPEYALPLAKADREDTAGLLGMTALAEAAAIGADQVKKPLTVLVERYEKWIEEQKARADQEELPPTHKVTAHRHMEEARTAVQRMQAGLQVLGEDSDVLKAFEVMNSVMQTQRVRQVIVRNGGNEPDKPVVGEWRPFQMAFVLLNLKGLADAKSKDRDIADLLWFPTGGGKTEAYLGLIAFVLVLRRLRKVGKNQDGAGVAVLMRYTLRLLTLQQFERAAGLICALQKAREAEPDLQETAPFSIGLWVGQGATPNSVADAQKALKKLAVDEEPGDTGNPVQLLRCPWCGTGLDYHDYSIRNPAGRLTVRCRAEGCDFHSGEGLPVHLVDDGVYEHRPSLVIGTVDKFAMLAWKGQGRALFGGKTDAPPDLIVQDELHLISGPLGTLVGLYETAIDHLATDETGARPKLVASTATIRRATEQVKMVFDREARQFPPPGLDASDSFFAVDASPEEKGTRKYVGLMAPSTSHASLLVRTYAALLQGAKDLNVNPEVRDAYWTLLGYFNSLRVLGAAYIQSIDDIPDRLKVVAGRLGTEVRKTRDPRELTSRVKSGDIPGELKALETSYPDPESPDVVLATNMISVGVDVDRLGLMAVMGQSQTTSEYIQSTSRVGRSVPGLVFTLYNAARSRDLSHYESFTSYHRALYKQVEATGATPFASRALDRGLHGLLVILARHAIRDASDEKSVDVPVESGQLIEVTKIIVDRARSVAGPEAAADVSEALLELSRQWEDAVEDGQAVQYGRWPSQPEVKSLMVVAGTSNKNDETGATLAEVFPPGGVPWPTLTSLRNVDRESTLKIISSKFLKKKAVVGDGDD